MCGSAQLVGVLLAARHFRPSQKRARTRQDELYDALQLCCFHLLCLLVSYRPLAKALARQLARSVTESAHRLPQDPYESHSTTALPPPRPPPAPTPAPNQSIMSRRRWDDRPAAEVCPPLPFLDLQPEMRREVLKFVVSASPNHGARFFARQAREKHPRDQTEPGFPLEAMDHARAGRATCTHWSTSACLTTVMHHTRTTRTVCSAIKGDMEALEAPRSPLATPRVWLSHLYEVPAAAVRDMSGQQVLRELRARSLTGRRANLVAEMQWRQDKLFDLNGPARTNFGRSVWSDRPRNSYELVATCPAAWSKKRKEAALALARNAKYHDDGGGGGDHDHCHGHGHSHHHHHGGPPPLRAQASWALTKVRTHEERHAVAPIDASLLGSPGGLGVRVLPEFNKTADVDGLCGVRHAHVPKQYARRRNCEGTDARRHRRGRSEDRRLLRGDDHGAATVDPAVDEQGAPWRSDDLGRVRGRMQVSGGAL